MAIAEMADARKDQGAPSRVRALLGRLMITRGADRMPMLGRRGRSQPQTNPRSSMRVLENLRRGRRGINMS